MPIQYINTGSGPNAGDGDSVRAAFNKVNSTFAYLSTMTNSGGSGVITTSSFTSTLAYYTGPQTISSTPRIEYDNGTLSIGNKSVTTGSFNTLVIENGFYNDAFSRGFLFAQSHNTADANNFQFYRSRGTSRNPTAVQFNDEIVDIQFMGFDGTTATTGLNIVPVIDGPVSRGYVPMALRFIQVTGLGVGTTLMSLTSTGTLFVNRLSHLASTTATYISINSDLVPEDRHSLDLGTTASQWTNIYASGTIYLNNIPLTVVTTSGNLLVNGLPVVGGVTSPVTLIGSTSTSAELPVSGTYGQAYIVTTTNQVWFWSTLTTSWQNAGPISGPRGLQGPAGPAGLSSTSTISNGTWTFSITTSGSIIYPNGVVQSTVPPVLTSGTGLNSEYGTGTVTLSLNTATLMASAVNATTATNAGYAFSFNTSTLVANAVNAQTVSGGVGVYTLTAGTGTAVSANSGTVVVWNTIPEFNTGTLVANAVNATTATNAGYAYSFNTGTLVANAVNATTATNAGYAYSFNTSTVVSTAVTATYAQSFNTNTVVSNAVTANTALYATTASSILNLNTASLLTLSNTATMFVGYAVTATQLTNLRVVSVPTSLIGTSTNKLGDIAVDSNYFYYCSGNYYPAVTNLYSYGQNDFTNPTATIVFTKNPDGPTPQAGWTLYASYSTWTIISVTDQGTTWSIAVSGLGGGTYNITTGTAFTMTNPSPGAIWYQTPWNAITNTGTVAYASAINTVSVPASSTSTGVKGQIAVNSTSMYVCVATNSWLRFAGATF